MRIDFFLPFQDAPILFRIPSSFYPLQFSSSSSSPLVVFHYTNNDDDDHIHNNNNLDSGEQSTPTNSFPPIMPTNSSSPSAKRQRLESLHHDPSTMPAPASAEDSFITDQDAIESGGDEDDEDDKPKTDRKAGRRKIKIEFIQDKSRRHITFSKRKAGIMKKVSPSMSLTTDLTRSLRADDAPSQCPGIRIIDLDRHTGPASRRFRDRPRLHVHHCQASTSRHSTRRQESHSSLSERAARHSSIIHACRPAPRTRCCHAHASTRRCCGVGASQCPWRSQHLGWEG